MQRSLLLAVLVFAACRDNTRTVVAELERAPGVREDATVTYLGVDIGHVESIAFDRGRVRLTLAIERPNVPLRSGDRVRVLTTSMFGDRGVEIVPGPASAPPLTTDVVLQPAMPDSLAEARRAAAEALGARIGDQIGALMRGESSAVKRDTARHDTAARPPSSR